MKTLKQRFEKWKYSEEEKEWCHAYIEDLIKDVKEWLQEYQDPFNCNYNNNGGCRDDRHIESYCTPRTCQKILMLKELIEELKK